jgi:hypothetical protein
VLPLTEKNTMATLGAILRAVCDARPKALEPPTRWFTHLAAFFALSCGQPNNATVGAVDLEPTGGQKAIIDPGNGGSAGTGNAGGASVGGAGGNAGTHACGGGHNGAPTGDIAPCELVGPLDGRLMQFPCSDTPSTDDCNGHGLGYVVDAVATPCSGGRLDMVLNHPVGGTPGARYLLTMHFYGIMQSRNYGPGVTREAAPAVPDRNGGNPVPWATAPAGTTYSPSAAASYEIHVHDQRGQELAQYYLNADIEGSRDRPHFTFLIDYEKTIEVTGGGFVRLRSVNETCRPLKNCGTEPGYPCAAKARTIDLSAVDPPAPPPGDFESGGFNQPGLNHDANHGGEWWLVDVTRVEEL